MLGIIITVLSVIIIFQFIYICNTKKQIKEISHILDDIGSGNLDRRLLAVENSIVSELVYKINAIVIRDKEKLMEKDKSEKAYKKLVTSLSHDIRTPLASLIGYLEVLEKNGVTGEEHDEFLTIARRKALNLGDYIQSLFEFLKIESGEWVYDLKKQNICELTRLILADWVIKLEENKIEFRFEIPEEAVYVVLDKSAYTRILTNLMANMIRHSHATQLSVRISCSLNELNLSIADNGIGIAEKDLPFVFDRLYKCDTSRTENSNGLGLSIAKELTASLHGEIHAESCWGRGTTFRLTFPKA